MRLPLCSQLQPTFVYNFFVKDTIEEHIYALGAFVAARLPIGANCLPIVCSSPRHVAHARSERRRRDSFAAGVDAGRSEADGLTMADLRALLGEADAASASAVVEVL